MHLTICFKLKTNSHDACLLTTALTRWSVAYTRAMDRAQSAEWKLLHHIVSWTSKDGTRTKLVIDNEALHADVLRFCHGLPKDLHSTARTSLIVAVEQQLASWLGLYIDWLKGERKQPKPGFPGRPTIDRKAWATEWPLRLEASQRLMTLAEEKRWRSDLLRGDQYRLLPMYFGAATSGGPRGAGHCGLLKREDGRYFALLTLWPNGDARGEPLVRSTNHEDAGRIMNVRSPYPFQPTNRMRSSMLIPLEYGSGKGARTKRWERVAFDRAAPQSATLVRKEDGFYLHVAFEFLDTPLRPQHGNVLAIRRGIGTLLFAVVIDGQGNLLRELQIDGRDLARTIAAIQNRRAIRQAKGKLTTGDRRASRVTEHLLYSAGHQTVEVACQHGARIVLLEDPFARKPQPFLAYKHFARMAEILTQLTQEAGLRPAEVRKLYGSRHTCVYCGWKPGDTVRVEIADTDTDVCGGCGRARNPERDPAYLLGLDTLRLDKKTEEKAPPLGEFIRSLKRA